MSTQNMKKNVRLKGVAQITSAQHRQISISSAEGKCTFQAPQWMRPKMVPTRNWMERWRRSEGRLFSDYLSGRICGWTRTTGLRRMLRLGSKAKQVPIIIGPAASVTTATTFTSESGAWCLCFCSAQAENLSAGPRVAACPEVYAIKEARWRC
jgi:hypothetical protein